MSHPTLSFVLAREPQLPAQPSGRADLELAQRSGPGSGVALRIYRAPDDWSSSLDELVRSGQAGAEGADPFGRPGGPWRLCDAVVPQVEPRLLWLGVYALDDPEVEGGVRCLDRFPLREAENETCWFYPTENGTYLSWENRRRLELRPGFLPEPAPALHPDRFRREDVHVLWSLMADDAALTCVGLTCGGRRIEWPVATSRPEAWATWCAFRVDTEAERTFEELDAITVFPGREVP